MFSQATDRGVDDVLVFPSAIEPAAVRAIREIADEMSLSLGTVGGECAHDRRTRQSRVAFFPAGHWIQALAFHFGAIANNQHWRFKLSGTVPVQFSVYGTGDHYDWHVDAEGLGEAFQAVRKVSVIIQLSSPEEYLGGAIQFREGGGGVDKDREFTPDGLDDLGSVAVFPSYVPHRVGPVTSGERRSLVAWLTGPRWT